MDDIYSRITAGPAPAIGTRPAEPIASIGSRLPEISAMRIIAATEALAAPPFNGHADLSSLAARLHLQASNLLVLAEVAQMMGFAELREGILRLTMAGHALAPEDAAGRKRMFADHILRSIPLVAHIRRVLDERPQHMALRNRFTDELEDHLNAEDAESTLRTATEWGRYAECFAYDDARRVFSLESPQ